MKKKSEVVKPKQDETQLQKRLRELHAEVDSRSDAVFALRMYTQTADHRLWKKKQRRSRT